MKDWIGCIVCRYIPINLDGSNKPLIHYPVILNVIICYIIVSAMHIAVIRASI